MGCLNRVLSQILEYTGAAVPPALETLPSIERCHAVLAAALDRQFPGRGAVLVERMCFADAHPDVVKAELPSVRANLEQDAVFARSSLANDFLQMDVPEEEEGDGNSSKKQPLVDTTHTALPPVEIIALQLACGALDDSWQPADGPPLAWAMPLHPHGVGRRSEEELAL